MYLDAWRKHRQGDAMQPLEQLIARVIGMHPEYHALLADEQVVDQDFMPELGESNPFMHMGMHIAIHEQLSSDRPSGILAAHHRLLQKRQDPHAVEHEMMECLGEALWEAQRTGSAPDEVQYLACVNKLTQR
jgi:hypothetical protein